MSARTPDLTIVVNTSDGFADCWDPFFDLFAIYWPKCRYPIVLNTERCEFERAGLALRTARVGTNVDQRLTWSECLMRCLEGIATPFVLYLQEDYFLEAPVRAEWIEPFLDVLRCGRADVIRLMECDGSGPWHPTDDARLWRVDARAQYRIALQAALWRTVTMRSVLRAHETAWQLEVFGSARARRPGQGHAVYCAARDRFHGPGREIFPYQPTGVVKGKWERRIVEPLFAKHRIEVDFSRRGFYDGTAGAARAPLVRRIADRARSLL